MFPTIRKNQLQTTNATTLSIAMNCALRWAVLRTSTAGGKQIQQETPKTYGCNCKSKARNLRNKFPFEHTHATFNCAPFRVVPPPFGYCMLPNSRNDPAPRSLLKRWACNTQMGPTGPEIGCKFVLGLGLALGLRHVCAWDWVGPWARQFSCSLAQQKTTMMVSRGERIAGLA